ncbi:MAG: coenzyme F420 biosynthesis-associated protein, partial [Actinobacteria bacterium]
RKGSFVEAVQSPEQREVFNKMTGVMSLLEGHADVVMDDVGPQVIPSVALIRERFSARRNSPKTIDALARRALGMDMKMRQYTEGAAFVRHVVDDIGMSGFNQVWTSPKTLPTRTEITNPGAWVKRMAS